MYPKGRVTQIPGNEMSDCKISEAALKMTPTKKPCLLKNSYFRSIISSDKGVMHLSLLYGQISLQRR